MQEISAHIDELRRTILNAAPDEENAESGGLNEVLCALRQYAHSIPLVKYHSHANTEVLKV